MEIVIHDEGEEVLAIYSVELAWIVNITCAINSQDRPQSGFITAFSSTQVPLYGNGVMIWNLGSFRSLNNIQAK